MHSFTAVAAIGLFAYKALAQSSSFYPPITFPNVTVGYIERIGWTPGDGTPVSLFLGNTSWNVAIFGMFDNPVSQGRSC